MDRYRIGNIYISCTTLTKTIDSIKTAIKENQSHYICVSNVRTVAYANKRCNDNYRQIMNKALLCIPDGMPLVWMARLWGLKDVQRTVGPDLFTSMLNDKESNIKHFLLGDTEKTLSNIIKRYANNNTQIVGTYSPPFCELDNFDYKNIAQLINESDAEIVWLSLRAPKQDFFAARLMPYLNKKICIGVGAAFRFSIGEFKHPPKIFKKFGLTGIFWRKMNLQKVGWYLHHFALLCKWGTDIVVSRCIGKKYNE